MDQHCWGCRKRRVVCDLGRPGCAKCARIGIECPGYGKQKPLQWLAVGRVKCKEKRKKPLSAAATEKQADGKVAVRKIESAVVDLSKSQDQFQVTPDLERNAYIRDEESASSAFYGRYANMLADDETTDVFRATWHWNQHVFPTLHNFHKMSPAPYLRIIATDLLPSIPPAMRHSLTILSLSNRLHRGEITGDVAWPKIYAHRGLALQDLNKTIGQGNLQGYHVYDEVQKNALIDKLIESIMMFVVVEVQYCASMHWRSHVEATARMIETRGGLEKLWNASPSTRVGLVHFSLIQNFAATTSPITPQTSIQPFEQLLSVPKTLQEDMFSYSLCPFPLLESIAYINRLRFQVAHDLIDRFEAQDVAELLLQQIQSFSVIKWAASRDAFVEDFELLASLYHCAVVLYCISSLQYLITTSTPSRKIRKAFGDRLLDLLDKATDGEHQLHYFITWPVVVAGVDAAGRSQHNQARIDDHLTNMSRHAGTCSALVARSLLRDFWASGLTGWDECFSTPYAFQC